MSKELIEFLRPYALLVIEQNGKIKAADFYQKLLLTCKNCGVDESWIESNSHQISIFTQKLIDVALYDWLEKQYKNYPHPTVRDGNKVISGKVESVSETSASSMYSYSEQCGWDLWRASGMSGGKKLQEITLHDEANSYYVVWGKDAIGVRQFNIIDFEWVDKNGYQIIVKKTLEGHGEGFGNSKSVTVNQVHYPSTEVHVLPRDIEFDLDYYKENTSVLLQSSLSFQARVAPVLMTNKAELLDFNLDENYFSPQDFDRSIAIKKVTVDAISLEKISEVALITITFDTKFVYVNSHDIVWNIERIRDKIVGYAKIRLFYIFNGVEKSTDISIPIRFV
ncbi:TPA: hypothetical protein ACVO40_003978 [Vibrio diabolicus]